MQWLIEFFANPYALTALSCWFIAQLIKVLINLVIHKKLIWERLIGDGGMPSGHSATVSSLAVFTALSCGTGSFQFAVTLILAIIVCHDAMGVRREAGKQAVVLNELIRAFDELGSTEKLPEVKLKEFVGHTPVQVMAGILVGIINALLMYLILF